MGLNKVAFFHLNIHAIFKSILFIGFGFAMLSSYHRQDNRIISYLFINPVIKILFFFSAFCLSGLPFLTGFFSKDFIIEALMSSENGVLESLLFLIFLGMRVYYGLKLVVLIRTNSVLRYRIIRTFGLISLLFSVLTIILLINIHITIVMTFRVMVFDFKYLVYFVILIFAIFRIYKFSRIIFYNIFFSIIWKDNIVVLWLRK